MDTRLTSACRVARTRAHGSIEHWGLTLAVTLALAYTNGGAAAEAVERAGKQVVDEVCVKCHGTGLNGAPRIGDGTAWAKRSAQGLSSLTSHALEGIRNMPPHGGNLTLTDVELERAITYMVNQSGGLWIEPSSRTRPVADRTGEDVVKARCVECHGAGKSGAPRVGDRAAWIPRLKPGFDSLVRSAINGHGGMPPRGGMANLTDAEIRNAIAYMIQDSSAAK